MWIETHGRSGEGFRDLWPFLVLNGWRNAIFLGLQPKNESQLVASGFSDLADFQPYNI